MKNPIAPVNDTHLTCHGDDRIDPYYWLRERENPEVIAYLEAENKYLKASLSHTDDLQDKLYDEITGRIKQDDTSVPYYDNGYYYRTKYSEGNEHPIYARYQGDSEASEQVMLDVNVLAQDYEYYHVAGRAVSPNNQFLAFGEDRLSRRIYTLRFKDLTNDHFLLDTIPNTTGHCVWANDNKHVFYTRKDETLRAYKIFRHEMGTDSASDVEIYHEEDDTFNVFIFKSTSKKYLIIGSVATLSNEYRFLAADTPLDPFTLFIPRQRSHEHSIDHAGDSFFIRTNLNAQNFRLCVCSPATRSVQSWKEVVPHRPNVLLDDMQIFNNFIVLSERKAGLTTLHIITKDGEDHFVDFSEEVYTVQIGINREYNSEWLRLHYTSLTTPPTVFDYQMQDRTLIQRKQLEVMGDFDADRYTAKRLSAFSPDGTSIPISLVHRKGISMDGTNPLLMYGYGSYGISIDPTFNSARLSLLDRGFVFAIAHIRGGQELGRAWYEGGKLLNKKNTFDDFIACGKKLVQMKYTSKKHMYAFGGSAGGLLIGAVINLAPDLFRGVIAAVPFVDVVTTMLDDSIPLTTGEYDEWGNPNDPSYYHYIKSYSPYDNIEEKDYPAMLVTTGLHDSQVQYWEPAKWVAKLRKYKTDNHPLYLFTNMGTGHGGASGRFERYRETAMEYAFLLDLEGTHS